MLSIEYTTKFKKDVKRVTRRGCKQGKLKDVIGLLVNKEALPAKYRDHSLVGNYAKRRECHIEPDWLLIYRIEGGTLYLERTGSHADLFN